ncbi:MAG TPA: acyl-CoA dehydrogenase family protein, partial [Kofleriaceae bacterium]|nr:acyl-CoA dehydrogenase family protein [Kofleriaceae bacterium]
MTSVEHRLSRIAADLTDEHLLVARAIRSYATTRLAPRAAERDRDGTYPLDELANLAELGLLAMKLPAELG